MKNVSVEQIVELQNKPSFVRNVCILAHVDHGKTTLADSLVASNGVISQRLAGKLRYMDSRKDEQQRGITMKSSAISLCHNFRDQDHLIHLIDSPGHVDFSGEVSTAIRLCDGAIIVVDVIEGVCPQTKEALRQAWMEHIKPVLVLNKMDRLITERKLNPLDAYVHLQQVLEQINVVVGQLFTTDILEKSSKESEAKPGNDNRETVYEWSSALEDTDDSTVYFAPEQGNVVFGSALDGWGFRVSDFAKLYATKLGMKEENLNRTLWGDFYLNTKNKHLMKGAQAKSKKPLFVQFILDNVWAVYEAVYSRRDKEMMEKIVKSLNLKLQARDMRHSDARVQLQAVFGQWLPLSSAVLDMVCQITPSPNCLNEERAQSLICSNTHRFDCLPPETQELKRNFLACSSEAEAPVIVCVSKMFVVEQNQLPRFKKKLLTTEEIQHRRELLRERKAKETVGAVVNGCDDKVVESTDNANSQENNGDNETKFIAFARVFSGTIRKGQQLYVLGPKHDPEKVLGSNVTIDPTLTLKELGSDEHVTVINVEELYLLMGRELEELDAVPAGNVLGIGGLDEHVLKSATLSTTLACPPFIDLHMHTVPILRVAIEPVHPSEIQQLLDGLKLLNQADPCVHVMVQETGEHVLITAGEVHLQRCLDDLREMFAKVEISVSQPIIPFRETIIIPPKLDMVNECIDESQRKATKNISEDGTIVRSDGSVALATSNKKCQIVIRAVPLPESVTDLLEKNADLLKVQDKTVLSTKTNSIASTLTEETVKALRDLKKNLTEAFDSSGPKWKSATEQIWAFGPRRNGCNLLLNRVPDYNRPSVWIDSKGHGDHTYSSKLSNYDASFVTGFQMATMSGPICEEPLMGVCFIVEQWDIFDSLNEASTDLNSNSCKTVYHGEAEECNGLGEEEGHCKFGIPFGPLTGQIMSAVKEGCRRAFQAQPQRLMAAMYSCNIQVTSEVLGKMYAVLGRRHGRILSSDLQEGSQTFNVTAILPVIESFDFSNEIRKQTSGMASPQLIFSHWEIVDVDPFWVPTTEEEYLHYGEKADSENHALKYMNAIRRRKGLAVDEKIVQHAEKQRTLMRKK